MTDIHQLPDWVHPENTTLVGLASALQPTVSMRASLIESDMDKIRAILREELQRQEGFLRAMVQEELEAHHDAYVTDELNVDMPPKSSRNVTINVTDRGRGRPELDIDLEEDENPFRKLIEEIFVHPMVSEVHACRECGKPIIHMEHLKLVKAQEIQNRAYGLLGIRDSIIVDEEEPT